MSEEKLIEILYEIYSKGVENKEVNLTEYAKLINGQVQGEIDEEEQEWLSRG